MIPKPDKESLQKRIRPPMETGSRTNKVRMVLEPITTLGLNSFKVVQRSETLVGDGSIGQRP